MQKQLAEAFVKANEAAGFDENDCRIREEYIGRGCSNSTTGIVGSISHLLALAVTFPEMFGKDNSQILESGFQIDSMGKYDQIIY
ncbi:hypothetical protein [Kamptonema sp. UHCC 0994]|uniref:hypothetical protein n=1 Tax=Kamptonema sp. UHCC 0994 TaxID=3031329 RepID=UPI0023B93B26|nr:hypothetical protein [Kamptonema sp. UHCC 0994]MDF0553149.1 hypothetical protein [Kamptonema sp. UHCC 0994]